MTPDACGFGLHRQQINYLILITNFSASDKLLHSYVPPLPPTAIRASIGVRLVAYRARRNAPSAPRGKVGLTAVFNSESQYNSKFG